MSIIEQARALGLLPKDHLTDKERSAKIEAAKQLRALRNQKKAKEREEARHRKAQRRVDARIQASALNDHIQPAGKQLSIKPSPAKYDSAVPDYTRTNRRQRTGPTL